VRAVSVSKSRSLPRPRARVEVEGERKEGMNLIGHMVNGKPELEIDCSGKYILTRFATKEIYGPFDSLEQVQEWAKANPD
jgi:hypothetical protein